jgi:GPH family glycoside/pentoside/hexuronide:cation symporter
MSEKLGKKKSFMISQGISVFGYVLFWFLFVPGKPYYFLYALPFFSFGIGGLFTLMMSMTADVCDLDELNNGRPRKEATFGAIYWLMVKFGFAFAGLLSGLIMSLVGFEPNAVEQPEGAVFWLRVVYSAFPILGTLLAIYIMRNYEISESKAQEIKRELLRREGTVVEPQS